MKKIGLLILTSLACMTMFGQAPSHLWAYSFGSVTNTDCANAVIADNNANGTYYVTGSFKGSMTINTSSGGNYTLTSAGGSDIFIAAYNSSGCISATRYGTTSDDDAKAITILSSVIYVTGNTGPNIFFGKVSSSFSNGASLTTLDLGYAGQGRGITTDGTNLFATGYFSSSAVFATSSTTNITLTSSSGNKDAFVVKFTPANFTSTYLYFTSAVNPNTSAGDVEANGIAYYSNYVYITGSFKSGLKVTSTSTNLTCSGYSDIFVAALNSGTLGFAPTGVQKGGSSAGTPGTSPGAAQYVDNGYGIAVNSNGVFITGTVNGAYTFNTLTSSAPTGLNAIIVHYPLSSGLPGQATWVNYITSSTTSLSAGFGIALNTSALGSFIYVTGEIHDHIATLYGQNSTSISLNNNSYSGFVAVYNQTNGNITKAYMPSSPTGCTVGHGISATCDGIVYAGSIEDATTFGNCPTVGFNGPGYSDCFAACITDITVSSNVTQLCSGASVGLTASYVGHGASTFTWSPSTNLSCSTCASPTFTATVTGSVAVVYTYTVTASVSGDDCPQKGVVSVTVYPYATANAGPDKSFCPTYASHIGTPSVAGATYSWSPTTWLSCSTCAQPYAHATGDYTVTVTSACGGTTTDVVHVTALTAGDCQYSCGECEIDDSGDRMANPANTTIEETTKFSIFPNPGQGQFNMTFTNDGKHEISVYDISGRMIMSTTMEGATGILNFDGNSAGTYMIKVSDANGESISKLVIQ
jgi:hypothetical protein